VVGAEPAVSLDAVVVDLRPTPRVMHFFEPRGRWVHEPRHALGRVCFDEVGRWIVVDPALAVAGALLRAPDPPVIESDLSLTRVQRRRFDPRVMECGRERAGSPDRQVQTNGPPLPGEVSDAHRIGSRLSREIQFEILVHQASGYGQLTSLYSTNLLAIPADEPVHRPLSGLA
jgi:hypothetical protein